MKLDAEKNAARYPMAERAAKSVRGHRGGRQRENHSGGLVVEAAGRFALVGLAAVDAVAGIAGSAFDLGLLPLRYFGM